VRAFFNCPPAEDPDLVVWPSSTLGVWSSSVERPIKVLRQVFKRSVPREGRNPHDLRSIASSGCLGWQPHARAATLTGLGGEQLAEVLQAADEDPLPGVLVTIRHDRMPDLGMAGVVAAVGGLPAHTITITPTLRRMPPCSRRGRSVGVHEPKTDNARGCSSSPPELVRILEERRRRNAKPWRRRSQGRGLMDGPVHDLEFTTQNWATSGNGRPWTKE